MSERAQSKSNYPAKAVVAGFLGLAAWRGAVAFVNVEQTMTDWSESAVYYNAATALLYAGNGDLAETDYDMGNKLYDDATDHLHHAGFALGESVLLLGGAYLTTRQSRRSRQAVAPTVKMPEDHPASTQLLSPSDTNVYPIYIPETQQMKLPDDYPPS